MDCSVIYYAAHRTALCENALRRATAPMGLQMVSSCFATDAASLGEKLCEAFTHSNVCFVVGGLEFSDSRSPSQILSHAAVHSHPDLLRRLPNANGEDGFVLRAGHQVLVLLPDEQEAIKQMLSGVMQAFMKSVISNTA